MGPFEVFIPLFAVLGLFGTIAGLGYLFFKTRHQERMALIEKGVDASLFHSKKDNRKQWPALKQGLLITGFGLGIFLGQLVGRYTVLDTEPATLSMILLFGGSGLLLYHFIASKKRYDEDDEFNRFED